MNFTYQRWDEFCKKLCQKGLKSIPACEVSSESESFLVLKHDVETDVARAYEIAKIECHYGHRGSYYVQAYLLESEKNVSMLTYMQQMGHEITYHHDVMDSCKGDLQKAVEEFEKNRQLFEKNGFPIYTVCQHGNPVVERHGYHSNRDFFRSVAVCQKYPGISDIMVNFKHNRAVDYLYFSDAGRHFQLIYDPINNDIIKSDDKNVLYDDLDTLLKYLSKDIGNIISMHPHRWTKSELLYGIKTFLFRTIKTIAKILIKIPILRRIMSRYYYLAKKI